MALQTRANFAAYLSPLSIIPGIGEKYANDAHIMRAIGNTRIYQPGQLRVNWTNGVDGQVLDSAVAAGLTHTASPGKVDESFTVDFGVLVAQASSDVVANMVDSASAQKSVNMAVNGLYRAWLSNIVGSGDGTLDTMLGVNTIVAKTTPTALGMHFSGSSDYSRSAYSAANMLSNIDYMRTLLPPDGENIVVCDSAAFMAVKAAVRSSAGGLTASEIGFQDFGFNCLMYDGSLFFHTPSIATMVHAATGCALLNSRKVGHFYFFNNGPEGVEIAVPAMDMFTKQGPKFSRTDASEVYDIFMKTQLIPNTPRAVGKLTCLIS